MPGIAELRPDEREQLLAYLAQQRDALRLAAHGLDDDEARLTPTASALSVGGIIKHVSDVEAYWIGLAAGTPRTAGGDGAAADSSRSGFRLGEGEGLDRTLQRYAAVAEETERVVRNLPVDHPVPVPRDVPWFPADVEAWTLRWVLLHLIEETARHAGHADIVRESIDGATAYPLMAAVEGWESPWVTPWQPRRRAGAGPG